MRVLIVGGYGTFGGRLVQLLGDEARLTLIVAGRSAAKAAAFCAGCRGKASLVPARFDRDGDGPAQISELVPDVVVDASGPFQAYGEGGYRLIEACLAQGIPYLDLADGSEFVAGVAAFDARARGAKVSVVSGASTFPALTAAVVRHLSAAMATIESIHAGIVPSPFADVGPNVIRAIASYAGRPVPLRRDGRDGLGYPFTETMRVSIAPPGCVPLKNTLFSLADVPDLRVLPQLFPEVKEVWIGVAPGPEVLHRALIAFSRLVRIRLLPSLSPFAPLLHAVSNNVRWGEHRGGMFVAVAGRSAAGVRVERSWHMVAEGDDGPLIPSMAAAAIIRRMLNGDAPAAGARTAAEVLEIEDYAPFFAGRAITPGIREGIAPGATLYRRVLGSAWDALPAPLQRMHDVTESLIAEGRATVERGTSLMARLVAAIVRFPKTGSDIPVRVRFEVKDGVETWTRSFAGRSFFSRQREGRGRSRHLLCENFGPLNFAMALLLDGERLRLVLRRWSAFGVPLPLWLGPRQSSFETVEDGRFRFHVDIGHPLTGVIVRYRGWLAPLAPSN